MYKILVVYDHFAPSWKAGGPIQSIVQLVNHLHHQFKFYIICSATEYGENKPMDSIITDEWVDWERKANVFYAFNSRLNISFFKNLFNTIKPDIIYINGLYSFYFNIIPLISALTYQKYSVNSKIILSPRGMLHPGALSQKKYKKKLYILFFRSLKVPNKVHWHATDETEYKFIRDKFRNAAITKASNFPKLLITSLSIPIKKEGELIMGTIALISPMKNHLKILEVLGSLKHKIEWHIYGPVKDYAYWEACQKMINSLPHNIRVLYHGAVSPEKVTSVLESVQLFIMPSKSENFGHAIYEALSNGRPVITTNTTPFLYLQKDMAGMTVNIENLTEELKAAIGHFTDMGQKEFTNYSIGARSYIQKKFNLEGTIIEYKNLFKV